MLKLNRETFFALEKQLRDMGLDSDRVSFDEIKQNLSNPRKLTPTEFASQCIYVILAGGFSQKTAKRVYEKVMEYLYSVPTTPPLGGVGLRVCRPVGGHDFVDDTISPPTDARDSAVDSPQGGSCWHRENLLKLFNNKNKINAVVKIWENREMYCNGYYNITTNQKSEIINQKLLYLSTLPHIGKITANHLARNLGENVVKYDVWIQRLGVAFVGAHTFALRRKHHPYCKHRGRKYAPLRDKIDNGKLDPDVRAACDEMFACLERETGLPRGYIDVVLWKACQTGLIQV